MKRLLPTLKGCARMLPSTAMAIAALTAGSVTATATDPGRPKAVDYSAISYEWTDTEGHTHISTLDRKAETYEQIVALLKEIYTNPAVPGFVKDPVGYGADYAEDRNENVEVKYAPCTRAPYAMPADMEVPVPVEGATALLVELKDDYKYDQNEDKSAEVLLKKVKAVSVLTKQMYIGEDVGSKNPGYLFNYVGTLDKFFIITKGSNRVPKGNPEGFAPFFQMFEEFSPSNTGPIYDAFTDMNSGRQFPVDHNCSTIMGQNHIVVMTGENADGDPHAVNFLFYLPDKRFAGDSRTNDRVHYYEWYTYYSEGHKPFVFFSKIFAAINEVPEADPAAGKARVKVEWKSTYKDVSKSQVPEEFYVYRVVDDVIQPHPLSLSEFDIDTAAHPSDMRIDDMIGAIISTGPDCSIFVKEDMRSISYNVRYIVLGRRWGSDFELTESNVVTACIPAADGPGDLEIRINGHGMSQYDASRELNNYSNSVSLLDHNVSGGRKLLRRHVSLKNGDNPDPVFILRRVNVKDGEIAGDPVEVARMKVINEEEKYDVVDGEHYLYTAQIIYAAGVDVAGLPLYATFKSKKSQSEVADIDMPVEALSAQGDMLAMFTDRFSVSTRNGDQSRAYGYYVEYVPEAGTSGDGRMDRTLSNMVEVTVPVRELRVGVIPYTAEEIAADRDADNLLPAANPTVWIETRSNPNVSQYVVTNMTTGERVAKVVRMATGRLEVSRADADGKWQACGSIENGYYAHPVVELISPVEPGDGFSLSLVYNNGNTYGNRRVVMEAMPGVSADEDGIFKHGFVDDTNPVDYQYHSAVLWSAVNASVQGTANPDGSHIIAGYRVWQTHDSENDYTLIWGLEGDGEDIPAGADTWGVAARGFVSHVATQQNPVTVDHKVRMYSVVPAAMRIPREENGAADAVYAVSDASISRTVTSLDNLTTGVDGIETPGGNVEYRYFDLTGREIKASDLSRGVYIRVGAGKSEKIIL